MNWAWAGSIEQLWHSPGFPMWLALAAAGLFGVVVLVALLRAEKSMANVALAMIAVLAIGAAATVFSYNGPVEPDGSRATSSGEVASLMQLPALACIEDLAGETVLAACERLLFSSPDTVAAAVSYISTRISRLVAAGDVATANKALTPELDRLRRSIERDRYGLVAYVLASRDRCQPGECAAYQSLTNHNLIAANMDEKLYETQIQRYAPGWNAAPGAVAALPAAALPPSMPTGKPTNADFPTSASIPPVNIMTPEPPAGAASAAVAKPAPVVAAKPAPVATPKSASTANPFPAPIPSSPAVAANAQAAAQTASPAKKPPAPPKPKPPVAAPVQLAPAPASAEE